MERKERRHHTREFKLEAVRLAAVGDKTKAKIARELGIRVNQLRQWRLDLEDEERNGVPKQELATAEQDLGALRRENARLREENELLKKRPSTSRRRRDEVRLCRVSAGTAFGAYAVSGLARVTQWVLRSPKPAAERQRRAPIISHHQDPGRASGQPRDVWRTASARRALDSGDCLLSKHGRQADAQSADYAQGDPAFSGNDRLAEYEGSLTQLGQAMLQSQAAQCLLAQRRHLHLNTRGLAVPGGGPRCVFPGYRGLGDEPIARRPVDHRRARHGNFQTRRSRSRALRSRLNLRNLNLPGPHSKARHPPEHEPQRKLLGHSV